MQNTQKIPLVDTAIQLLRHVLVVTVIVAVAALAVFWESMPNSVKNTVASFSTSQADYANDDGLIPLRFRIDNISESSENTLQQSTQSTRLDNLPDETDTRDMVVDDATLSRLHDELKQLGVTACQLTYWGNERNMFRFSCQVPVSEQNPNAVRTFQSIRHDANQSIQEVIDQVRQWQLSRNAL